MQKPKVTKIRKINKLFCFTAAIAALFIGAYILQRAELASLKSAKASSAALGSSIGGKAQDKAKALLGEGDRGDAMDLAKYWYWRSYYDISSDLFGLINQSDEAKYGPSSPESLSSKLWQGLSQVNGMDYIKGTASLEEFTDIRTRYLRGDSNSKSVSELYGGGYAGVSLKQARLKVQYGIMKPASAQALKAVNDAITVLTFEPEYDSPDQFGQLALDYSAFDYNSGEDPWAN